MLNKETEEGANSCRSESAHNRKFHFAANHKQIGCDGGDDSDQQIKEGVEGIDIEDIYMV